MKDPSKSTASAVASASAPTTQATGGKAPAKQEIKKPVEPESDDDVMGGLFG